MVYKFKVEVYRRTPYGGVMLALLTLIGIPASIVLLQKIDSLSIDTRPTMQPLAIFHAHPLSEQIQKPKISRSTPTSKQKDSFVSERKKTFPDVKTVPLMIDNVRKLTCVFEGKATYRGYPYPDASVLVKVSTPSGTQIRTATTHADGSYRVEVPIRAVDNDNLDWSIEAYTNEFKRVELVGRKIVMEGATVSIEQTLAFLPHKS